MMVSAAVASQNDLLVFPKKKQKQVKREKLNLSYI